MGESRNEDILQSIINGTAYTAVPQSRIEVLLLALKQVIEAGSVDTYTKAEIDNLISAIIQEIDWKEAVATFADLATTYPDAEEGWTASVLDTDEIYRFNGAAWVNIYTLPPLATSLSAGLMSSSDKDKLDTIEREANKTVVDPSLSDSSGNPVQNKVINSALSGKVDKITGKGLSTNDFTDAEKSKLAGIESGANKTTVDSALSSSSTNPLQNKAINTALSGKVDKVTGKGLSTNDFTTSEKAKLSGIETGAQVNPTLLTKSSADYIHAAEYSDSNPISSNFLRYWNGNISGAVSNLQYCDKGRFGTAAAANNQQFLQYKNLGIWSGETQDANTVLGQGIFDSTNWTNTPWNSTNGALLNINLTGNNIDAENSSGVQLFFRHATPKVWIRYNYGLNQTIGDWAEFLTTSNCVIDKDASDLSTDEYAQNYTKFPNGLIIQWGWKSNTTSGDTFTFPLAFSVAPSVTLNRGKATAISKRAFTYTRDSDDTLDDYTIFWTAVGYIN